MPSGSSKHLIPILLAPWGRNGSTAVMRLLASSDVVAAPTSHPYEQFRLSAMFRAAQLLGGQREKPRHGWGNEGLFPDVWEDCLKPLSYVDPGLADGNTVVRHCFRGLWQGFENAVQEVRAGNDLLPARYYAEKSEPLLSAEISTLIECRILFVLRDPRDVLISSRDFNRRRNNYTYGWQEDTDIPALVRWQIERVRRDIRQFDRLGSDGTPALLLRYEDMIGAQAEFIGALQHWLDIELDPMALAAEAEEHGERHVTSASSTRSTERWRHELPDDLKALYLEIAADLFERFDYGR